MQLRIMSKDKEICTSNLLKQKQQNFKKTKKNRNLLAHND